MNKVLSIVIANYNYGRYLESAIRSVVDQPGFDECELIIVDGGSSDNSVEVIKKFKDKITWWCSEKDAGQSDAFNKGFLKATGKYLTWLNSDDLLVPGCLRKVLDKLLSYPECEWFTANFYRFTDDGSVIECLWGPHTLPFILQGTGRPVAVYGPSSFFTKDLFVRMGGMKKYQYFMMDTDLWMRFIVAGVKQRRINTFCWAFRMHLDSKTAEFGGHKLPAEQRAKFEAERRQSLVETGYRFNRMNSIAIKFWRIFDGSALKSALLKISFRKVEFK